MNGTFFGPVGNMLRSIDIWHCAIVKKAAHELRQEDLVPENLVWLPRPDGSFAFRADPFGLWHEGRLHCFVERFDYRDLKGCIELLVYDAQWNLLEKEVVLSRPWHLSYPFIVRAEGQVWMLPEARRSGELTLYRARAFPRGWEPVAKITGAGHGVDGTLLFHEGRWWLFYAIVRRGRDPASELHVAFADSLAGPWWPHPMNPVRTGLANTRPAGSPIVQDDGTIALPVQDGSRTYGGAVRRLRIASLTDSQFEAIDSDWLAPAPALDPFVGGLHTVSAAGEVSLIDCKFVDRSIPGTLTWRLGRMAERRRTRAARKALRFSSPLL